MPLNVISEHNSGMSFLNTTLTGIGDADISENAITYRFFHSWYFHCHSYVGYQPSCIQFLMTKRRRSDSVLWQKPLHPRKCQKGKLTTQATPQKSSIKQRLRTDLGRSVCTLLNRLYGGINFWTQVQLFLKQWQSESKYVTNKWAFISS